MLTVEPDVIEQYVRTGKVKLLFRDVLNHGERSDRASEAAVCAGRQGYFWAMHEILFQEQDTTAATANNAMVPLLKEYAARIPQLNQAQFAKDLEGRVTLAALKAADAEQRKRGINSQPIFEIGKRRLVGLQSFPAMKEALDAALANG